MYAIKRTTTTYLLIYIYTKDMLYIFYNITECFDAMTFVPCSFPSRARLHASRRKEQHVIRTCMPTVYMHAGTWRRHMPNAGYIDHARIMSCSI